jgi:hypothetical protein
MGMMIAMLLASTAEAATFAASSVRARIGDFDGTVRSLAAAGEGKVLRIYTNRRGKLAIDVGFKGLAAGSGLSLQAALKTDSATDTFTFQVKNASGSFTNLTSVTAAKDGKTAQAAIAPANVISGAVTVRLISSAGADDLQLDSLTLSSGAVVTPPQSQPPPPPVQTSGSPTWYWQLQGTLNTSVNAEYYDIDLFDTSTATIQALKNSGRKVICYFSAGTYEEWRSDAAQFPAAGMGANMEDWPGERWLDVRNLLVREIMKKRLDLAKSKGCHGVEPDNVDGYSNKNGVGLTKADQIAYNGFLADEAHARGLSVALKNSTDLVAALVNKFDFAVVEECFAYNECEAYSPFVQQNKAVFNAEYTKYSATTCTKAKQLGISTAFFNLDLNGKVFNPCP